jgi:hypothetical protein
MDAVTKSDIKEILTQLAILREDVEYMKSAIKDKDCILREDDQEAIREYEKEKKEKTLIGIDQIKKSLIRQKNI